MSFINVKAIKSVKSTRPSSASRNYSFVSAGSYSITIDPGVVTTIEPYCASPSADAPEDVVVDGFFVATLADGRTITVDTVARGEIIAARNAA